jgi:hypothetical protein
MPAHKKSPDVTNLTELAYCFSCHPASTTVSRVRGLAARFRLPGESIEQGLARQQASFDRIAAKAKAKRSQP